MIKIFKKYGVELKEDKLYGVIFLLFSNDGVEGENLAEIVGRFDSDLLLDMIENINELDLYEKIKALSYEHDDIKPYEALVELGYSAIENEDSNHKMTLRNPKYSVLKLIKLMVPESIEMSID